MLLVIPVIGDCSYQTGNTLLPARLVGQLATYQNVKLDNLCVYNIREVNIV